MFKRKNQNPKLAAKIVNQTVEFIHCALSPRTSTLKMVQRIRWERPPTGWVKPNTDGSAIGKSSIVGCGGIIKYKNGLWVIGFSRRIGITNSFVAE